MGYTVYYCCQSPLDVQLVLSITSCKFQLSRSSDRILHTHARTHVHIKWEATEIQ